MVAPATPRQYEMDTSDERYSLRAHVIRALEAVPVHFTSPISIEGIDAADLFGMNTLLGGAIETQTVKVLNRLRNIWDPDERYSRYEFKRFPESFPDVRLIGPNEDIEPLIGIELKGWYLLSKEAAPSFRFTASANAMTEYDLLVCYPWSLGNVLSGKPVVHSPFMEQAKYAADMRTYYWQSRTGKNISEQDLIIEFANTHPYPPARSKYSDTPKHDRGGNFGRVARSNIMDDFIEKSKNIPLAGIEARYWIAFLKIFSEGKTRTAIEKGIKEIETKIAGEHGFAKLPDKVEDLLLHIRSVIESATS